MHSLEAKLSIFRCYEAAGRERLQVPARPARASKHALAQGQSEYG